MALLEPLLEVQDLDLQTDRLDSERENLAERSALLACGVEIEANDRLQAQVCEQRDASLRDEREVAREVAAVAAGAKDVEDRLYSGKVTISKELEALQEELRLTRARQGGLEDRELEIMEQIEAQDGELARLAGLRDDAVTRSEGLRSAIAAAEEKIAGKLAVLAEQRQPFMAALPAAFAEEYAELRDKPRLAGRAAAGLVDGLCQGCRGSLPRLQLSRILAEPEESLLKCPHCARLLVR